MYMYMYLFLHFQDQTQLSHVVQSLCTGSGSQESQLMEPEYFQFLLLMLISVGKSRPENLMLLANQIGDSLVRAREGSASSKPEAEGEEKMEFSDVERVSAFIQLLNDVFWRLLSKRPLSPVVAPIVNPGAYYYYQLFARRPLPMRMVGKGRQA